MKYVRFVILNVVKDLLGFQIKSGMMKLSFFVIFVLGISIILLTHKTTAQEKNQQAYDVACEVKDVSSLKECIQGAKEGKYDLVKITGIIECASKDDCAVDLSNLSAPLTIYGISNTATGFRRTGQFDYSLFTINNTKDLTIGSFFIDDSSGGDCAALGIPCPAQISMNDGKNTIVDQLKTVAAKNIALTIQNASNVTIKNSEFDASGNHSVVVTTSSSNIRIEKNTFTNSSSDALVFAASDGTNVISENTFAGNHKDAFYEGCIGICVGAQLRIMPLTKNILIEKNVIKDAIISVYNAFGLYASGIEISPVLVENVTVSCNKIYNNSGNGVVISNRTASTKQIIMKQNAIYNNGINVNFYLQPGDDVQNNCFDAFCKVDGC